MIGAASLLEAMVCIQHATMNMPCTQTIYDLYAYTVKPITILVSYVYKPVEINEVFHNHRT